MTTRKHFIAATAALAATPQLAAAATPAKASPADAPLPKLHFDLSGFDASLDRYVPHKHLFADRHLDSGSGIDAVENTLNAYRDLAIPLGDVTTAMVFYHGASICMAMDDHVWNAYLLPALQMMRPKSNALTKDFDTV